MNILGRCPRNHRLVGVILMLLTGSLLGIGCGADDDAPQDAAALTARDRSMRENKCLIDQPKICANTSECRWVSSVGCLSKERLRSDPSPKSTKLAGEYEGEFFPAEGVIGEGESHEAYMVLRQQADQLSGEFSVEIKGVRLKADIVGRVFEQDIAFAFTSPTCIPLKDEAACDNWYNADWSLPERFVGQGLLRGEELIVGPTLPRNSAGPGGFGDNLYMHPHDGFKPTTDDPSPTEHAPESAEASAD